MKGFYVTAPEVLIARRLERGGRYAPGLDFIRWRLADLRVEVQDDAEFWGIPARDIARSRAAQIAEARGAKTTREPCDPTLSARSAYSDLRHPGQQGTVGPK